MHITLIYPPLYFNSPSLPEGQGAAQHLGLAYLSSWLKKHHHSTSVINAFNQGLTNSRHIPYKGQNLYAIGLAPEQILARIPPQTDLLGIGIPFSNSFPLVKEILSFVKKNRPDLKITTGGMHASLFPQNCIDSGSDYVIIGEGEKPLLDLAEGKDPLTISTLISAQKKNIMQSGSDPGITDLDQLPFPDYSKEDLSCFFTHPPRGGKAHKSITLVTSRGCPFSCRFCSIHPVYGRKWRARSAENVLEEMKFWYTDHQVTHFEFEDDNLTLDHNRAAAIFEGIISWGAPVSWAALNGVRVDTLDKEIISLMKRSGCVQLNLAIESGNKTVLSRMNKHLSLDKVREVVKSCGQSGIKAAAFLLIGYPGETPKSFKETIRYFKELRKTGLHAAIPLIINAYPGTALNIECKENGWLATGTDDHIFCENDDFVSIITPEVNARTIRSWKKKAELEINGRMRYYKSMFKRLTG